MNDWTGENLEDRLYILTENHPYGEATFRTLFDQSPIGAAIVLLDYRFLKANDQFCRIVGYSEQELMSMTFLHLTHPDDVEANLREQQRLMTGEIDRFTMEKRYIHKTGRLVWVRVSVRLIRNARGNPLHFLPMIEDISQVKQASDLMKVQRDIALGLGSTGNFTEAMELLLDKLLSLDGIDSGGIYTVNPKTHVLHLVSHRGISERFVKKVSTYLPEAPQAKLVMAGEPTYWSLGEYLPQSREILEEEGLKTLSAIPVKHEGRVVASLNLASHAQTQHSPATCYGLEAIGAQIGSLIARFHAEEALLAIRDDLEHRVQERTSELEETNTALRVMLKHREGDRRELEERILHNVQQMVLPYIDKMKGSRLDSRQKTFLELLESNINEIISPFQRNLFWKFPNLTPSELQVASLVQEGKRAHEIAELLGITEGTVKFHKINLRRKCGLKERGVNLKAFLQSLKKV